MASPSLTSGVVVLAEPVTSPSPSPSSKILATTQSSQAKGKKRPASPGNSSSPALVSGNTSKKKRLSFSASMIEPPPQPPQMAAADSVAEMRMASSSDTGPAAVEPTAKPLPFKDPNFVHSGIGGAAAGKKNRTWKNLKQILAAERALPWQLSDPNYYNIDAPPSFKPAKKYSDISGLPANYTDPQTKLRFTSSEEFSYIRLLPTDVVTGYLALRKATCIVP
ncbi:INO80 complex subunit C isoform X3 [Conger conger]|uniref:INO80 complex subunit C isoform X3 n=1 Tax=Conger conger TaxID=82655 RepID=UPI002A5A458A|nr:INO80 complex subunit C isoform X3 [Conger conger]